MEITRNRNHSYQQFERSVSNPLVASTECITRRIHGLKLGGIVHPSDADGATLSLLIFSS